MSMNIEKIKCIIEAALLAAGSSLSKERMVELFAEEEKVKTSDITKALDALIQETEGRGVELVEVATGYRYQARQDYAEWIARLWEERPSRYSRALLETLSLIAYRQPTTRSDIEQVRGVGVSSSIIKTLLEREWIRVVGHRDVPGKPALYATTKYFLDYFGLKSLDELPSLAEIKDLDNLNPELKFDGDEEAANSSESEQEVDADDTNHAEQEAEEETGEEHYSDEQSSVEVSEGAGSDEDDAPQEHIDDESDGAEEDSNAQEAEVGSSEGEEESDASLKPTELH
ncbi:SMC-Scp complex subunit ScpB [Kangiella taiwanensis]|uniref:SMC-Scp complex subunit ScpB n=1 Tax=Kangiella taiwanensis TaxID=1079179 RepID=A0ABP8I1G6_9GAMM|nr:SMC-Scp complex subunit ScpB [Kangiella taiwanensis]